MFQALRERMAAGLEILAQRISTEPRYAGASRVSTSPRTFAGVAITPDTAITVAAVWACLRYLSQTVAVLPWHVMRDGAKGATIAKTHPIDWLLYKRPNPEWSAFQFKETLTHWSLRHGNGYAEIEPNANDTAPAALWPIHPDRTECCRAIDDMLATNGDEIAAGELFYEVSNGTGGKVVMAARRMFHLRGFGEGPVGVNVIHYAAQSIGWARAAQLFGSTFFGNGMNASGFVTLKKGLNQNGHKLLKAELDQLYKGVRNSHKAVILDNEADFKPLGVDPQKAQLLELHQFLVEEICRWFGVPPHKVMHLLRATFSNIEHQAIEVVVDSVSPWVKRFEDEADWKLFGQNRMGFYTKMNMKALLRGDNEARIAFYKGMFDMGVYSPNDILEHEDENTLGPDGDKHLVQLNLTTLEHAGEQPEPAAPASAGANDNQQIEENAAAAAARVRAESLLELA